MTATATFSEPDKLIAQALGKVGEIASLPELTTKIIRIVENPKSTARDLFDVIRCDPALSARILKVVNSAFYGLPGQIANIDRAIVLLGLSAVKNIAVAASMTHLFNGGSQIDGLSGVDLWKHSLTVGVACKLLTTAQGRPSVEESFLAGLIHDIGILIERQVFGDKLGEALNKQKETGSSFSHSEREIISAALHRHRLSPPTDGRGGSQSRTVRTCTRCRRAGVPGRHRLHVDCNWRKLRRRNACHPQS